MDRGPRREQPVNIAIIGDNNVGKSSLCYRFFNKRAPPEQYKPTLAVDYFVKPIINHPKVSRFAVFDVSVTPQIYSRSPCLGIVYDVGNEASFLKAADLITFIDSYNPVSEKSVIFVANNCCTTNRIVTTQAGITLATKWKAKYIETDAMFGNNVESLFWTFASELCKQLYPPKHSRRKQRSGSVSLKFTSSPTLQQSPGILDATMVGIQTEDEFRSETMAAEEDIELSESTQLIGGGKPRCCACLLM